MAGLEKPIVPDLGEEIILTDVSGAGYQGSLEGLFDSVVRESWNSNNVCYWNSPTTSSITFTTPCGVNIWRCGTNEWSYRNSTFKKVERLNEETGNFEIAGDVGQYDITVGLNQWEKSIHIPIAGTYRFTGVNSNYRIDSEWYVEKFIPKRELKFYKTLSSDVPDKVEAGLEEVHFTEKGEIFTYTNDGKKLQLGGSETSSSGKMSLKTREW